MHASPESESARRTYFRWRFEVELLLLIAIVASAYFFRAAELPLRGEEPTRIQIAREMVRSGDPLVPREQGELFLSRPPLQNWLIAVSCQLSGDWSAAPARLPSIIATFLTTLVVYWYSRSFLSATGSLAAAAAFATMGEMFQTGRLAETEAVFIFFVGASLLVWHGGFVYGWSELAAWITGYALMTLGALTKGPQAPVYFLSSITVYLLVTRQWRRLFTRAHLAGIAVSLLIASAWLIPFYGEVGWKGIHDVWVGDSAIRFRDWKIKEVLNHLLVFPLEVFGCTMPWSPFLLLYLNRRVRGSWREIRPQILFVSICVIPGFLSCWIPPGGVSRYFSPLYPCLVVLIGAAVDRCTQVDAPGIVAKCWNGFAYISSAVMAIAAAAVLAAPVLKSWPLASRFAEPPVVAICYAAASIGLAFLALRARQPGDASRVRLGVMAVGAFMTLTFVVVLIDVRIRRSEHTRESVAHLKELLPASETLYSFGHVDSLFAYYYEKPIVPLSWTAARANRVDDADYFCFFNEGTGRPALPFDWQEIAAVSVDRNHQEPPDTVVVVGRRTVPLHPRNSASAAASALNFARSAPSR
jgi:4-amino-4-deoxy-L-arabinose transferase-like glycosyltransferase